MSKKIAIIGAGISGTNLAYKLQKAGHQVEIFEKSRGAGGRTSTRRFTDNQGKDYFIDHGAQYIDVVSGEFQEFIDELEHKGIVEKFSKLQTINTYVAVPNMNAIAKFLSQEIKSHFGIQITKVKRDKKNTLINEEGKTYSDFDLVISTAPPKQTAEILSDFKNFDALKDVEMKAHFAVMLISNKNSSFDFTEKHLPQNTVLNWIGINSAKPQREEKLAIIMHTNFKWTQANKDIDRDKVIQAAIKELKTLTNFEDEEPIYLACHRWLYGRTIEPLGKDFIWDEENQIAACGDYMLGDDIEAAYLSSSRLAEKIIFQNKE